MFNIFKRKTKSEFEGFEIPSGDPLKLEHEALLKWVNDALTVLSPQERSYKDVDLKIHASGRVLLESDPQQGRRYVMAAFQQVRFLDEKMEEIRSQAKTEMERVNAHMLPGWDAVWGPRRQTMAVIMALMRRALPFERDDLLAILQWGAGTDRINTYLAPIGAIARALERFHKEHGLDDELKEAGRKFAVQLRSGYDKDAKRIATSIEQLCSDGAAMAEAVEEADIPHNPVVPAAAGNPKVLDQLKRYLGLIEGEAPITDDIGLDHMPLRLDSPLAREHALLCELFEQVVGSPQYAAPDLNRHKAGMKILAGDDDARGLMLLAAAERAANAQLSQLPLAEHAGWQSRYAATPTFDNIAEYPLRLDRNGLFDLLLFISARPTTAGELAQTFLPQVEKEAQTSPLTEGERYTLHLLRAKLIGGPPLGTPGQEIHRLSKLIGDGAQFYLVPGEAWTDALNHDLTQSPREKRRNWVSLLTHLLSADGARPSAKWLKTTQKLVDEIGAPDVRHNLLNWLALVNKPRTIRRLGDPRSTGDVMHEENANVLRGMLWITPLLKPDAQLTRAISATALSAYRKVPGVGPRAVKVGNAAIYALSEIASEDAVGQLAMLKVRVKFGTAQKEIEKAYTAAAEALGLPRDEIEEMGVPSYGLEEVGLRREKFGDYSAELRVDGRDVTLSWTGPDGKPLKSVPAKVKADSKEELKELQTAAKDIDAMLPAQSERLDSMFLIQKRWAQSAWTERYLDHPLVGTLARRLIWNFITPKHTITGIWLDGKIVNVDDEPLKLPDDAQVELWHPIGRPMDDVLAWREWLQKHEVRQPFKQAHREIYLLTDAERRTNTYSNRFAAHIIRQHQFNALCGARGWKNKLRLAVDDTYPPASRALPGWALRAEFWIEGIGDDYGTDTNESGVYLRLSTDQVRFYRIGAAENLAHAGGGGYATSAGGPGRGDTNEPLPLSEVPPLVFSEIMRDVDLFVGVASVGNDPTWQDGGPQGRHLTYWQSYSFGDLGETAKTRKAVLERLIPRLKIADRCSFSDKFLVVRGDLRTYKIHLGSGNILMEPNDQYLCIVPNRSAKSEGGDVFLPFEGDATMSVIISKAFLLAADKKISDPTIVTQIKL
jgi:hypothetical protein